MLLPAVASAADNEDHANLHLEMTKLAAALALHQREHGSYPESLDALVPELLDEIPIDIFADGPLAYQRRGDGYLLYSVGRNAIDDGGSNEDDGITNGEWIDESDEPDDEEPGAPIAHSLGNPHDADDLVIRVPIPPLFGTK